MKKNKLMCCFVFMMLLFVTDKNIFAESKHIRFAAVEWEPYYGSKLEGQGYFTALTKASLNKVGYTMSIDFIPWKRAIHDTKNLYYNGVLGLYYSDERASLFEYSKPVDVAEIVLLFNKGSMIDWNAIEELRSLRIGTIMGYVYSRAFDEATFLQKEPVRKMDLNFKKFMTGKIDAIADEKKVLLYWINLNYPNLKNSVEIAPKNIATNILFNGFCRNDPNYLRYVRAFNKGLEMIRADGTYEKILKQYGF